MARKTNIDEDRAAQRAAQRVTEIERLHLFEHGAVRSGTKLGPRDRLKAAYHLTCAWNKAKEAGLPKTDFQELVFARLRRAHGKREEFRLTNWALRRGEDPFKQDLTVAYQDKRTPHKALEPYLAGIAIAAEHCEVDPDDWKLAMVRDLSIWSRQSRQADVVPPDDRPAETLAILLNALCAELAQQNKLGDTFDAIDRMGCRWELFGERLVATDQACMDFLKSPISPVFEDCIYFEEMFPFPSIPLLRVPYAVGKLEVFHLAPEALLRTLDGEDMVSGDYLFFGTPARDVHGRRRDFNIPDDAPGLEVVPGDIFWFREIRLCIVPGGRGGLTAALESRPRVEVSFDEAHEFGGRHQVIGGYQIDRSLFYKRAEDGGPVFPHIRTKGGDVWRLKIPLRPDGSLPCTEWTERNPETTGWMFEPDPVMNPRAAGYEPWDLSYTPATQPYLRHWLTQNWPLADETAVCPWSPGNFLEDDSEGRQYENYPPSYELNYPDLSHASCIERCLHNGLIEKELQAQIDNLQSQAQGLQASWHAARERHSNALLRRWKTKSDEKDIDQ